MCIFGEGSGHLSYYYSQVPDRVSWFCLSGGALTLYEEMHCSVIGLRFLSISCHPNNLFLFTLSMCNKPVVFYFLKICGLDS